MLIHSLFSFCWIFSPYWCPTGRNLRHCLVAPWLATNLRPEIWLQMRGHRRDYPRNRPISRFGVSQFRCRLQRSDTYGAVRQHMPVQQHEQLQLLKRRKAQPSPCMLNERNTKYIIQKVVPQVPSQKVCLPFLSVSIREWPRNEQFHRSYSNCC